LSKRSLTSTQKGRFVVSSFFISGSNTWCSHFRSTVSQRLHSTSTLWTKSLGSSPVNCALLHNFNFKVRTFQIISTMDLTRTPGRSIASDRRSCDPKTATDPAFPCSIMDSWGLVRLVQMTPHCQEASLHRSFLCDHHIVCLPAHVLIQ
jgi:hypothetical protein